MPHKRSRSPSEGSSSNLPERVSLPRHSVKGAPPSKKLKPRPQDCDVVSISSASDNEAASKAKESPKRLVFGSIKEEKVVESPTRKVPDRVRVPSEKARYMASAENHESDSEAQKTPSKKRKVDAVTVSASKKKKGNVSESWDDWTDTDTTKLTKNDRNAALSSQSKKDTSKSSDRQENDQVRKDRETRRAHSTPPLSSSQPSSSRKSDKGKLRALPSEHEDGYDSVKSPSHRRRHSVEKSHRRDASVDDPDGRSTPTPSSRKSKDKGKARALTSEHGNESDDNRTPRRRHHAVDEDKTPTASKPSKDAPTSKFSKEGTSSKTSKEGVGLKDVSYPDMPSRCFTFSSFKHLPHTFTLEGRRSNLLSMERFYNAMSRADRGSFLSALNFTRLNSFINPSRSRLNNINVGTGGRLVFGRDDTAICFFHGAVAYCSLVEPTTINGANIRCISVYPFKDDFIQWKKFIASATQKTDFITTTDNDVVSFLTKKEASQEDSGPTCSSSSAPVKSPKKASKFFEEEGEGAESCKLLFKHKVPVSLAYNDTVAIYDARDSEFRLEEHYNTIANLPFYKHGTEDLPQFAVVTVGHTVSSFNYSNEKNLTALQLHVLFVILHGFIKEDQSTD